MCNLEESVYSCGHKRLHMLDGQGCKAVHSSNGKRHFPPRFCRNEIRIASTKSISQPCRPECERHHVLSILSKCYQEAVQKIEAMSKRASAIQAAMEKGKPPVCFPRLAEQQWDLSILQALSEASFAALGPLLVDFTIAKKAVLKELKDLHAASELAISEHTISINDKTSQIISFDDSSLIALGDDGRAQLYDMICEMERRASEACLEKHGWKMPDEDEVQARMLTERAAWKRGTLSGTRMDDAWMGAELQSGFDLVGVESMCCDVCRS